MSKDFKDFISGFQEVHFHLLAEKVENNLQVNLPFTAENVNDLISKIWVMNTQTTFEILQAYHDWIYQEDQ